MSMACHASGGLLATGGVDRKVLLWDVDGGFCTHFFRGHEGVVTVIAFHPNPETSLVFSGSLCVINCASPLASCLGLDNQLNARDDRIHFITVGELGIVRVWKSEGMF
ncbi:hypothetical protein MLD38_018568 [Melastoma candidum]|uniref:Uncharacterized protein n=1 Tax=Melastoma candidum TaxID=119954 RepID=A0ACB9QU93_9MYRT|nr:hypothetical protein MLD38_018568 [Melastoma candidum]